MENEWAYTVEQGMLSPRDKTVGWRHWDTFEALSAAKISAKSLGLARILKVKVVAVYEDGKPVKEDT